MLTKTLTMSILSWCGSWQRLRDRISLLDVADRGEGRLLKTRHAIEIEGYDKPTICAEYLNYVFTPKFM